MGWLGGKSPTEPESCRPTIGPPGPEALGLGADQPPLGTSGGGREPGGWRFTSPPLCASSAVPLRRSPTGLAAQGPWTPGDVAGRTLGAVLAGPPEAQRPGQTPENGPFGPLSKSQTNQSPLWSAQIGRDSKETRRHPKLAAHSVGHPSHQCYTCLPRGAPLAVTPGRLCAQPSSSPCRSHPTGLALTAFVQFVAIICSLPHHVCLQRDPLLGPSVPHPLKTPTRQHLVICRAHHGPC